MSGNFWKRLLRHLPLYSAEGGQYTELDKAELLKLLQTADTEDAPHTETLLAMAQDLLDRAGVLDPLRLAEGKWRFLSYPARLFACSLFSLFTSDRGIFREGFWAADTNASLFEQHGILHRLEALREQSAGSVPIRRTFVAWGIVRRGGSFILKRRENQEGDPDNALHGSYGFPGGRVNLNDLTGSSKNWTIGRKLSFLYGAPEPLSKEEETVAEEALERALARELREELGLEPKIHYTWSRASFQTPPETFIHGANAHHCITECRIAIYEISLTEKGDAFLSDRKEDEIFTLNEIVSPRSDERSVFFDPSNLSLRNYLEKLPDSATSLQIKRSELDRPEFTTNGAKTKRGKKEETVYAILPISDKNDLFLGDRRISLADMPRHVELLLLLGLATREDVRVNLLSQTLERKNWGWILLDAPLRALAHELDSHLTRVCGAPLLLIQNSLCRLRLDGENVFFNRNLFRAKLSRTEKNDTELTLTRNPLFCMGLFSTDGESQTVVLTEANGNHLWNLLNEKSDLVAWDNLRKLQIWGNGPMDDFVHKNGLHQLYEPLDATLFKERQRFRFAIPVELG